MNRKRWTVRTRQRWERARTSLWFIPALLVVLAIALSTATLRLDAALGTGHVRGFWLFGGNAEGARTVLSVIAGSLITVVAVAFSVTVVALQQASTQFTPRVLRRFTSDRGNQAVLGTYIATFAYALLVLRRVREGGEGGVGFVPAISISTAMLLSLLSLALLVYFVHHVTESLQVGSLLSNVRGEIDREVKRAYPEPDHDPAAPGRTEGSVEERGARPLRDVVSDQEGYLRRVDSRGLGESARHGAEFLDVAVRAGNYVVRGDVLARVALTRPKTPQLIDSIRDAFEIDRERSVDQDALYGVQQLVDMALKALSPGINDPTTAEQVLDQLAGILKLLAERELGRSRVIIAGSLRCVLNVPTFADYVDACFSQIRRASRADLHVSLHLLGILERLCAQGWGSPKELPLRAQHEEVLQGFDRDRLTARERALLDSKDLMGALIPLAPLQ